MIMIISSSMFFVGFMKLMMAATKGEKVSPRSSADKELRRKCTKKPVDFEFLKPKDLRASAVAVSERNSLVYPNKKHCGRKNANESEAVLQQTPHSHTAVFSSLQHAIEALLLSLLSCLVEAQLSYLSNYLLVYSCKLPRQFV